MKLPKRLSSCLPLLRRAQLSVYAGNAAFYLVLSFLPLLTLLASLLSFTALRPEDLLSMLARIAPGEVLPLFEELLRLAEQNRRAWISLSTLACVWSASRGIYGISRGLNAALDLSETRPYWKLRLLCLVHMALLMAAVGFLLLLCLFGAQLLGLMERRGLWSAKILLFFLRHFRLYSLLLLTALFCLLFLALPNRRQRLSRVFPGALGAAGAWLLFSRFFSFYVAHFARGALLYGSLSAMVLGMLWVYACVSILFYGAFCNRLLFLCEQ